MSTQQAMVATQAITQNEFNNAVVLGPQQCRGILMDLFGDAQGLEVHTGPKGPDQVVVIQRTTTKVVRVFINYKDGAPRAAQVWERDITLPHGQDKEVLVGTIQPERFYARLTAMLNAA